MAAVESRQRHHDDPRGAHEVVHKTAVRGNALHHLLDAAAHRLVGNPQRLVTVEHARFEHDGDIKRAARLDDDDRVAALKRIHEFIGALVIQGRTLAEVRAIARVAHDAWDRHLRQRRRTDLESFRGDQAVYVTREVLIAVFVQHLKPTAAGARPGIFLADAAHGQGRHVADPFAHVHAWIAVVDDVRVDLVRDHEETVFTGDFRDLLEDVARVHRAGGVVGRQQQDPRDGIVVFHLLADVVHIGQPAIVGIKLIGDVVVSRMRGFRRGMGAVRGRWPQDPRLAP